MTESLLAAALRRRVSLRWRINERQVVVTFKHSADAETFVREVERGEPAVQARGKVVNPRRIWQEETDG